MRPGSLTIALLSGLSSPGPFQAPQEPNDAEDATDAATVEVARPGGTHPAGVLRLGGPACQPRWMPEFGGYPGTSDTVSALAVFDDGGGPALYVGGSFFYAGDAQLHKLAKWDGRAWTSVG